MGRASLALGVVVALTGCAPREPTTPDVEHPAGALMQRAYRDEVKAYDDARLSAYVNAVAARLAARAAIRVEVTIDDVPSTNAHAALGGSIHVERGLLALATSESELAVILAHEIAHVAARHTLYSFVNDDVHYDPESPFAGAAFRLDRELQADRLGLAYLRAAGYAPRSMLLILRASERATIVEGGVDTTARKRLAHASRLGADVDGGEIGRDAYLDRVEGLVYGERPKDGAPLRIRVRRVTLGGRFDQVVMGLCKAWRPASEIALLNGVDAATSIDAGTRLKCIEP